MGNGWTLTADLIRDLANSPDGSNSNLTAALQAAGIGTETHTDRYDAAGRMTQQTVRDLAGNLRNDVVYAKDAVGNLTQTTVRQYGSSAATTTYAYTYNDFDSKKAATVTVTQAGMQSGTTQNSYDANGNLIEADTAGGGNPVIKRSLSNDVQGQVLKATDRKGALQAMQCCKDSLEEAQSVLADSGYVGEPFAQSVRETLGEAVTVQIAKCNELHKFAVILKRWAVEHSFAWLEKNRRLWKNCERWLNTSLQFIHLVFLAMLLRRS